MKTLIVALSLLIATTCYAEVKLYRYTEKASGDEAGIAYSKDPIVNAKWNYEVISEKDKQTYIALKEQQEAKKQSAQESEKDRKKKKCKAKLKDLGFDKDEINAILGDAYGD
jgi:Holliday junction resolvasome RuvABC DNA-binding subunit